MRLFIVGATGGIGRALVDQAIERGHSVTAFVRSPEKLGPPREGLTVVKGDPRSVDELREALSDRDAVLSAVDDSPSFERQARWFSVTSSASQRPRRPKSSARWSWIACGQPSSGLPRRQIAVRRICSCGESSSCTWR